MVDEQPILVERRGAIQLITLNRPRQRNALDIPMRLAIGEAIFEARDDDAVRAVVITGAGGNFCAGGDLKALAEERRPVHRNRDRIRRLHLWFHELSNLEKPLVAAVDGFAFGAGFNLALAADFILCTPRARFAQVFAKTGLVPDLGGFFLLPRIVGLQRAKELVYTARTVEPAEAQGLGIVHSVHEPDALLDAALALTGKLTEASMESLGMAKTILNQSFNLDQRALAELESYAQAIALDSEYHRDAAQRFLGKQPLRFNW